MTYFKKYTGELLLTLCALSYSFEWYFIRELHNNNLNSLDIAIARSFYTSIIITFVFCLFKRELFNFSKVKKFELKCLICQVFIMILCSVCFNTAIQITTVANTLVLFYSCIFWGALFGFIFLKEKITSKILFFTVLAFLGTCIALLKTESSVNLHFGKGELFALIGSLLFPLDAVFAKKIKHVNTMQRLLLINFFCIIFGIIYIPLFFGFGYFKIFFTPEAILYALFLGLFCGFIAKGLMYAGYNRTPVSIALVILLLEPIFQMTTAFFIAGEKISYINIMGIFIVFIMVILISIEKSKTPSLQS